MAEKLKVLGLCTVILFVAALHLSAQNNGADAAGSSEFGGMEGTEDAADDSAGFSRGSIPEDLLRPRRGEAPRYPVDTVIGALGQGEAPLEAYLFAREVLAAFVAGNKDAPGLSAMNGVLLEGFFSALETISPRSFRIGSGREESDGAVSFLVRFIGREQGIVGELFVRRADRSAAGRRAAPVTDSPGETSAAAGSADGTRAAEVSVDAGDAGWSAAVNEGPAVGTESGGGWVFEDLILEEARDRETENKDADPRFDFSPYERFF
ncbi:MAG: hypothetical protein LBS57_03390 [Treponema sp.]|jgi:hypothetical protein|nr:hypothetical protein [Treponema sp.]